MSDDGSSRPRDEKVSLSGEPEGLEGAKARSVAAREAWVRDGLLVSRDSLAQRWGVSLEDVAAMVERGELFELEAGGQRWVPAVVLELPRDVVTEVSRVLSEGGTDASTAFVFWHRNHGALAGRPVKGALERGASREAVLLLAKAVLGAGRV